MSEVLADAENDFVNAGGEVGAVDQGAIAAAIDVGGSCGDPPPLAVDPINRDADTGRATYHDYLVKYGPPTYETRDGNMRMVQWTEQKIIGFQGTIVTRREIMTIWFDESDVMRRWEKHRR